MDKRVPETYAKDSTATLLNKLSDPYVNAIHWASDALAKLDLALMDVFACAPSITSVPFNYFFKEYKPMLLAKVY